MNLRQWFTNSPALTTVIDEVVLRGSFQAYWDLFVIQKKTPCSSHRSLWSFLLTCSSPNATFSVLLQHLILLVSSPLFLFQLRHSSHPCGIKDLTGMKFSMTSYKQEYNRIAREIERASGLITARYLDFDKKLPVEMHVFCDACPTTAAGCSVFFVQNDKVKFIASKIFCKDFPSIPSHYWTDSTECLHWLFSHKLLKVFTRNRKTEILQLTDLSSWSHVRSEDNPVDYTVPWMYCRRATALNIVEEWSIMVNRPFTLANLESYTIRRRQLCFGLSCGRLRR
ncbi:hypothetical protein OS493_038900 [Desmophyllum pertusum]|uniref:Uncharacterized protein n=1 Tax=Desmophyllum pertusum TaxID=174260 RepID=A0A9W9ZHF8_9CNID|nr:hypothetical protein OS493_038900 [Desmophyllum pertusum]